MALMQERFSSGLNGKFVLTWKPILTSWRKSFLRLNSFFGDLETPSLYFEWTSVGLLATSIHDAYRKKAMTLIERPIPRSSGRLGRLDLWFQINTKDKSIERLDYRMEAKQFSINQLSANLAVQQIVESARPDFSRAYNSGKGNWSLRTGSITFVNVELQKHAFTSALSTALDDFECELWTRLNQSIPKVVSLGNDPHLIMTSIGHPKCEYMEYGGRKLAAIFMIIYGCYEQYP